MAVLVGCAFVPVAIVLSYILRAWALMKLWEWFILPLWKLPVPSAGAVLGLSIIIGLLVEQHTTGTEAQDKDVSPGMRIWTSLFSMLAKYPIAVGCGWIVKHWM